MAKALKDMTKSEKLDHLKGKWTKQGLERKILEAKYKRSNDTTLTVLQKFFIDGDDQANIASICKISRQGVSNTLTRFIARLYN